MLKQLLIATALTATSVATFANTGLYVQGDLGASKLDVSIKDEDGNGKLKKTSVAPRIAVGQDTGHIRYQADYTYFGKISDNYTETHGDVTATDSGKITAHSLGFSAIYDFDTKTTLTPYVGARLGLNIISAEGKETERNANTNTFRSDSYSERKTKVGAGVLAGVQYSINPNMALNAGLEYNYLGKVDGTKVNQYGANLGLRYNF